MAGIFKNQSHRVILVLLRRAEDERHYGTTAQRRSGAMA